MPNFTITPAFFALSPRRFATSVLVFGAVLVAAKGARADSCFELSYQRNAIFKAAGYCFHTAQQIANFGNAGCAYDNQADVPLSGRQRARIAEIVREERALGCRY